MQGKCDRRWGFLVLLCSLLGCATVPPAAAPPPPPPTSAATPTTTIVAIAPPAVAKGTIWDFLGVKMLCNDICMAATAGFNLLDSQFPALTSGMALPGAANANNPAAAAAASAKADAAAASGKINALRYLGTLGCGGCYPEVEEALLAALDDCIEAVRFEAASVLADNSRNQCRYCNSSRCCSPAIRKKLIKVATETRDNGCFVEPSARVRRMARVALCNCGCDAEEAIPQPLPMEGPSSDPTVPPKPDPSVGVKNNNNQPAQVARRSTQSRQSNSDRNLNSNVETADFEGKNPDKNRSIEAASSAVKPYDSSHKQADIVVKPPESTNRPGYAVVTGNDPSNSQLKSRQDQSAPRVRWERAAVSVYRFDTRDEAIAVMEFVRRQSTGDSTAVSTNPNLKYVTTREVDWTRPQDVRSPELLKVLFEMPVGQVSPVIEVGDILLVCRVLERIPDYPAQSRTSSISTQSKRSNELHNVSFEDEDE